MTKHPVTLNSIKRSRSHQIEQLTADLLYKNALSTNLAAIAGSIFVAFFLSRLITGNLSVWLSAMLLISAMRLFLYRNYRRQQSNFTHKQWINLYALSSFFAGTGWASIVVYLPDSGTAYTTSAFYLSILVPLTATAPTLSVSRRAFYAFSLPISIACLSFFLIDESSLSAFISIAAVMYLFFILSIAKHLHQHIKDGFLLQVKNNMLIDNLNREIHCRSQIQSELEKTQLSLEDTIAQRTTELRQTNEALLTEINERKRIESNLKHLAHHDALTNLPNRLLLDARLSHAIETASRNDQKIAVLFIDLDHFKNINDSLGHDVGDALIIEVSKRLLHCMREVDTVSRLGGDEFVVLIEQISGLHDLENILVKIKAATSQCITIREHEIYTSASIGISLYPDDGHSAEQLLRNADAAMYHAKETGRHKHHFYTRDLTASAYDRVILETDLRNAIRNNEFEVFYQPQISLQSDCVIGAEALIRWHHPDLGLLSPGQFLVIAEQYGMMTDLGFWVLRQACQQMVQWQQQGTTITSMAVNLSGSQIRHSKLLETVQQVLKETNCKPEWLELEITEDFIIKESESSISTLQQLRDLGISLAIDDFGTGYSSLNHIKRLPVNKLKIDRSFICDLSNDMEDAALVQAIISMGQSLNLTLIAEGVESSSHEIFLEAHNCDVVQGFRYSKPVSADNLIDYMQTFQQHSTDAPTIARH